MAISIPLAELFANQIFCNRLGTAIKCYGQGAVRAVEHRHEYCPGCGFQVPSQTLQTVLYHPDFCNNCGRMLLDEHHELLPAFSAVFNVFATNKRVSQEELLTV